ncbi:hypothetical protein NDU88_002062 [Pleurodeles waltl]|uniref:Reverse transcriptase zinc-binding domain-containing protein n=1 Tax=Pleurodeles waltl TaxID=8319 RepID=A0AAV7VDG6_PLEWA|nr:hypothetical protein NDU88_002062 [Pleurodeles waltl]
MTPLVKRWELAGFSKIGDFRAKDNWETPLNILTTVKNDFLLVGSYNILLHILRDLDIDSIANVQSVVTELVDPPGIRTAGSWRRLLADRDKVDLGTKAQTKWARQEGLEVSSVYWETINRLNFSVLRGANWHQMIFFSKWLLYRTLQALSRIGTGYPDMCFRCKEVGVAGWIHMIATCRCIQGYWEGVFVMLTTMTSVSISPSIRLMSLGYDPEARLSSRWEKLVFIDTAVTRSLLLKKWLPLEEPVLSEAEIPIMWVKESALNEVEWGEESDDDTVWVEDGPFSSTKWVEKNSYEFDPQRTPWQKSHQDEGEGELLEPGLDRQTEAMVRGCSLCASSAKSDENGTVIFSRGARGALDAVQAFLGLADYAKFVQGFSSIVLLLEEQVLSEAEIPIMWVKESAMNEVEWGSCFFCV